MRLDARPLARTNLLLRAVDGDWVIYDPLADSVVILNAPAVDALRLCDGTREVGVILREMVALYTGEESAIREDTLNLLIDFTRRGFLSDAPDAPAP